VLAGRLWYHDGALEPGPALKLRQLVTGIAAGYASKGVQLVASLLLVPFFLREEVLGLDGYGRAFTVSALIGLLPLLTGGLSFSLIRSISRALDAGEGETRPHEALGAGIKILGGACAVALVGTLLVGPWVLPGVGLEPSRDVWGALAISGLLYWLENAFGLVRAPLLARGAITFVNATGAAEVLGRSLCYFVVFSIWPATLTLFFAIQLVFVGLRGLAQLVFLWRQWPDNLRGALRAPVSAGADAVRRSWPITTQIGTMTLVHRLPVILSNALLGPEASGLAALALITVRGYVLQTLFAVVQPIAVPLASRLDPRQLTPHRRALLWKLEAVYIFVSGLLVATGVACMPELIGLWLGEGYAPVVLAAQAVLLSCSVEVAFNGRLSLLIGQGLLGRALPGILAGTGVVVAASAFAVASLGSWQLAVLAVVLYFPLTMGLGVDVAYRSTLLAREEAEHPRSRPLLFLLAAGAVAWALSAPELGRGLLPMLGRVLADAVAVALLGHLLLLSLGETLATLRTLGRSLDRSIVGEAAPTEPGGP